MIEFEVDMEYCMDWLDSVVLIDENRELPDMMFVPKEPERTCVFEDVKWDNGACTWGCQCSNCGHKFEHESGITWSYCPHCGARVVK